MHPGTHIVCPPSGEPVSPPSGEPDPGPRAEKTIFIIDDHPVVRFGLASLIEPEPDLAVCGEAATCAAALEAIRESRPDLAIVDHSHGRFNGLDLVKELKKRHPKIPALVLSMHDESVYAERALRAGAGATSAKRRSATRC